MIAYAPRGSGGPSAVGTRLVLTSVRIPDLTSGSAAAASELTAHVTFGQNPVGTRQARDTDGTVIVTFDAPVALAAGDRLEIDLH
jgi:hypothetical protein